MYGLRKIIQIDGFIPKKRTIIEVDQHSMIGGGNGAGKTSTLKLLSFFYGGEPGQLDKHAVGRGSFIDFYLPRSTSLLVFEYERDTGLHCVVVYKHKSAAKHVYRFLESGFSPEYFDFTDSGKNNYHKGYELSTYWKSLDLSFSNQIEIIAEYRSIIQNDKNWINRPGNRTNRQKLRMLASQYCLGSKDTHMRYIDRVCASIISRSGNLLRMKDMLAEIMTEDGVVFPETPIHSADIALADEIQAIRAFEQEIPKFEESLSIHHRRLFTEDNLSSYAGQYLQFKSDNQQDLELNESNHQLINDQLVGLQTAYESEFNELNQQFIEARNEWESCNNRIKVLDKEYSDYESKDMEQKSADFDNIRDFERLKEEAENRVEQLNSDVKSERAEVDRRINKVNENYERDREKKDSLLELKKKELDGKKDIFNNSILDNNNNQTDNIEQVRADAQPVLTGLERKQAIAESESTNGNLTDDERKEQALLQGEISSLRKSAKQSKIQLNLLQDKFSEAKEDREQCNKDYLKAKSKLSRLLDEYDLLLQIAHAEKDTWLYHLRSQQPEWVAHLGKIVHPDLLLRKDLNPEFKLGDTEQIFGWVVNLNKIPTPVHAESEAEIQFQLEEKQSEIDNARIRSEDIKEKYRLSGDAFNNAEEYFNSSSLKHKHIKNQLSDAESSYFQSLSKINDAVAERKLLAKKNADSLIKEIHKYKSRLDQQIQTIKDQHSRAKSEIQGNWWTEESELNDSIKRVKGELSDLKDHKVKLIKTIKSDFKKLCSLKGIDEKTLQQADNEFKNAIDRLNQVKGNSSEVSLYRQWMKNEWCKRFDLPDDLNRYAEEKSKIEYQMDTLKNDLQRNKKEKNKAKSQLEGRIRTIKAQLEELKTIHAALSPYLLDKSALPVTKPFELFIKEINRLLQERDTLKIDLIERMRSINTLIDHHGQSNISKAWDTAKDHLKDQIQINDTYSESFLINLPLALDRFIKDEFPSIKSGKFESLRTVGKGLNDFFHGLSSTHKDIKRQSNRITKSIGQHMKIEALSSIEIELSSSINQLDYWDTLNNFSDLWEEWRLDPTDSLPADELLNELKRLIGILQNIKTNHRLRDFFDLRIIMVEQGNKRIIRTENEMDSSTSEGLKYLALCTIYIAISRFLCPDRNVALHWPIDELGILSGNNISLLFSMLDQGGFIMVSGFPSEDPNLLRHFIYRQVIDIKDGVKIIKIPDTTLKDRILNKLSENSHAC